METARPVALVLGMLLVAPAASAHQPIVSEGSATDSRHAIPLDDVQVSRVIYHEITPEAPRVWLTFEVSDPQSLMLQLGVPVIPALADYRPAMAILGPELPALSLPFPVPEGLGGLVFESRATTEPEFFAEPFSGTQSWIVAETDVSLPAAGRYYVVGYAPTSETGKLWIALGEKEAFDAGDLAALCQEIAAVRAFHEIPSGAGLPCLSFPCAVAVLGSLLFTAGRLPTRSRLGHQPSTID